MSRDGMRAAAGNPRDPWRRLPVGQQGDPLLPRWFAVFAVAMVPVGIAVVVVAFLWAGRGEVPVAERRPPGDREAALTHDVGELELGAAAPEPLDAPCARLRGFRIAGEQADVVALREGLAALCTPGLPEGVHAALRRLADQEVVVRFAVFERTAVDSTTHDAEPAVVMLNAKYARTEPRWIAPLVAYEATLATGPPWWEAQAVLIARRAEHGVCTTLGRVRPLDSPGCRDAAALLDLDDPLAALREAGFSE